MLWCCVGDTSSKDEILPNLGECFDVLNVDKLCLEFYGYVLICKNLSTFANGNPRIFGTYGGMQNVDTL